VLLLYPCSSVLLMYTCSTPVPVYTFPTPISEYTCAAAVSLYYHFTTHVPKHHCNTRVPIVLLYFSISPNPCTSTLLLLYPRTAVLFVYPLYSYTIHVRCIPVLPLYYSCNPVPLYHVHIIPVLLMYTCTSVLSLYTCSPVLHYSCVLLMYPYTTNEPL